MQISKHKVRFMAMWYSKDKFFNYIIIISRFNVFQYHFLVIHYKKYILNRAFQQILIKNLNIYSNK